MSRELINVQTRLSALSASYDEGRLSIAELLETVSRMEARQLDFFKELDNKVERYSRKNWLSINELADLLNINRATVYPWMESGKIPEEACNHSTGKWRFDRRIIEEVFLNKPSGDE